jgi:hypothetical protein
MHCVLQHVTLHLATVDIGEPSQSASSDTSFWSIASMAMSLRACSCCCMSAQPRICLSTPCACVHMHMCRLILMQYIFPQQVNLVQVDLDVIHMTVSDEGRQNSVTDAKCCRCVKVYLTRCWQLLQCEDDKRANVFCDVNNLRLYASCKVEYTHPGRSFHIKRL